MNFYDFVLAMFDRHSDELMLLAALGTLVLGGIFAVVSAGVMVRDEAGEDSPKSSTDRRWHKALCARI